MNKLTFIICYFLLGGIVGALLGKRRKMGQWKGALIGSLLNWLGWIIIAVSELPEGTLITKSKKKRRKTILITIGMIFILLSVLYLIGIFVISIPEGRMSTPIMGIILFGSIGISILKKGMSIDVNEE